MTGLPCPLVHEPNATCPWCGHDDDCQPGTPGQSPHHFLCCLDRYRAPCLTGDRPALDRIMREEREDKEAL